MVAIFDYDPRESSPNTDIEAELTFSAGDIIHVFGDMDEDGFFYGDLNGHRGLVPSNFLQALPDDPPAERPPAAPAPEPKKESQGKWTSSKELREPGPSSPDQTPHPQADQSERTDPQPKLANPNSEQVEAAPPAADSSPATADSPAQGKKKKGFFSKGKKLFRKLGSSKKD